MTFSEYKLLTLWGLALGLLIFIPLPFGAWTVGAWVLLAVAILETRKLARKGG